MNFQKKKIQIYVPKGQLIINLQFWAQKRTLNERKIINHKNNENNIISNTKNKYSK